jgi:hypothetical protein
MDLRRGQGELRLVDFVPVLNDGKLVPSRKRLAMNFAAFSLTNPGRVRQRDAAK